jgi:hypothetical protein
MEPNGKEHVMMTHKFALGEIVLCTDRRFDTAWKAPYVIHEHIGSKAVDPLYRIRSLHWHNTRIASEHELRRMPQCHRAAGAPGEPSPEDRLYLEAANLNALPVAELPFASCYRQSMIGGLHV